MEHTNDELEHDAGQTEETGDQLDETLQETTSPTQNAEVTMESLLAQEELMLPSAGEVKEGVVVRVTDNEALVSIGAKSEGIIPGKELAQLSDEDRAKIIVGATINVFVVVPEDSQGNLILSVSRALEEDDWDEAIRLLESSDMVECTISGYNRGGLIVNYGRLRGFVPASQVGPARRATLGSGSPDQRWAQLVGETMLVRAVEVDRERHRLIMSELAAMQEAREVYKDRLLEEISEGDILNGRVTSLAQFGAFVNINGADGLVHVTELSWDRIEHPGDVLKVGEEVKVKVINVDREKKRIGLSIRQTQVDPWPNRIGKYQEGQLVEGKIIRLAKFGAFAELEPDIEGLIHISELSDKRIEHPREVVNEGDVVTLRVIKIDVDQRRVGLSLRKVHSQAYADLDMQMAMEEMGVTFSTDDDEDLEEDDDIQVEAAAEVSVEAEPEAAPLEAEPEADAVVEVEPVAEVAVETEPEAAPLEAEPEADAVVEVEPVAKVAVETEPEANVVVEVEAAAEVAVETEPESVPLETEPEADAVVEVEPAAEAEVEVDEAPAEDDDAGEKALTD